MEQNSYVTPPITLKKTQKKRTYHLFNIQEFYEGAHWFDDGIHFFPMCKINESGEYVTFHSVRNLNAYGFKKNIQLSELYTRPVYYYMYALPDGFPMFRKDMDKSYFSLFKRDGF
eukprot:TRINITY_DN6888_c0_g1_i1.p1 TRINITY_DN6888_c0_g1~~TRINITY_DN6888_c0_g1_i1.p1  ORF type:complete len:115 (-),score=18.24 TRINITY_DN6888_c0_g1_i1:442-786(-)